MGEEREWCGGRSGICIASRILLHPPGEGYQAHDELYIIRTIRVVGSRGVGGGEKNQVRARPEANVAWA